MTDIRLTNAALDESADEIVLRGVLDPESLPLLKVADYQREILPGTRARNLEAVLASGSSVPDITLGMRGGAFTEGKNGVFTLHDRVFIIDGLQRTNAAIKVAGQNALYQRVSWKQLMNRSQIINATGLVRHAAQLHAHFGGGLDVYDVIKTATQMAKLKIPRSAIRDNVKTFWQLIDMNWKVREITYKEFAPHIKNTFLTVLATMFNAHEDFWDDAVFKVPPIHRKKLALFPLSDPGITRLCSSGGNAARILYPILVEHMDSGKKINRLRPFNALPLRGIIEEEQGGVEWRQPN